MPSYQEVIQELDAFSLSDAVGRNNAIGRIETFMNHIRPRIDQVLRENPNLTAEEKSAIDEKEGRIFETVNSQFPSGQSQGGRRRGTRKGHKARKGRTAHRRRRATRGRK